MVKEKGNSDSFQKRSAGLLKNQVHLLKNRNSERYEIEPIQSHLSFDKGFFIFVRACQMLAQNNDGVVFVGIAGPSGAGKTIFTEKVMSVIPGIAVISMDNYNDASRLIDGNFDGNQFLI